MATLLLGTGVVGIVAAIAVGAIGVVVGGSALRRARGLDEQARTNERRALELRVAGLAERHDGELTAEIVAKDLGVRAEEAERALTALVDGQRVLLEVDENDGTMHYVFPAAKKARVQVRVPGEAPSAMDEDQAAEIEREVERVKKRRL